MTLKNLVEEAHRIAREHGFWEKYDQVPAEFKPLVDAGFQMLMVSEVAEATEEGRAGKPPVYFNATHGMITSDDLAGSFELREGDHLLKPEGALIELADAVIRIADYCGVKGWDLEAAIKTKMKYNESRPYKHGKKF